MRGYAKSAALHEHHFEPGVNAEDHRISDADHNGFDLSMECEESPTLLRRFEGQV